MVSGTAIRAVAGSSDGELPRRAKRPAIPAEVRRAVWERDGGCCAWIGKDGRRCGSTWMLEFDHVRPVALGGTSTVDDLAVACRAHNFHAAELIFGREFMEQFRRKPAANALSSDGGADGAEFAHSAASGRKNGGGASTGAGASGADGGMSTAAASGGTGTSDAGRSDATETSTGAVPQFIPGKEDCK
jgi:hypothetical protein